MSVNSKSKNKVRSVRLDDETHERILSKFGTLRLALEYMAKKIKGGKK